MTQGCYTCRRRRIICDNGLPTCRKCRNAGKECLGYKKPLVWVKGGVASRGRMMGRSFEDVNRSTENDNYNGNATEAKPDGSNTTDYNQQDTWNADDFAGGSGPLVARPTLEAVGPEDNSWVDAANFVPTPGSVPSPWGLVDPLLKDHTDLSRFYICHCMSRSPCSKDEGLTSQLINISSTILSSTLTSRILTAISFH